MANRALVAMGAAAWLAALAALAAASPQGYHYSAPALPAEVTKEETTPAGPSEGALVVTASAVATEAATDATADASAEGPEGVTVAAGKAATQGPPGPSGSSEEERPYVYERPSKPFPGYPARGAPEAAVEAAVEETDVRVAVGPVPPAAFE